MQMEKEKTTPSGNASRRRRKRTGLKILGYVLGGIVVLILLVFLLAPVAASSNKGRQLILSLINKSIPGHADFSDLSIGWLKGIKVADLSFNDNAGEISVKVREISTEPHYGSLLIGNLSFGQTTIDQPNIQINLKEQKKNVSSDSSPVTRATSDQRRAASIALTTDIVVKDGSVKITAPKTKTLELTNINTEAVLRPPGQQSSLNLDMVVAQADKPSQIKVAGQLTPEKKEGWSLKGTTGELSIDITDLKLDSLASLFALAGVQVQAEGLVQGHIKSQVRDGQIENVNASVNATNLNITGAALKGDRLRSSVLTAELRLTGKDQLINIDNLQVKTDWADLKASGSLPTTLKSLDSLLDSKSNYNLAGNFNCDVATVVSQMPATIGLKETAQIKSGRITGNIQTLTQDGRKQIQAAAKLFDLTGSVQGKPVSLSQPVQVTAQLSTGQTMALNVSSSFAAINCGGSLESLKYDSKVNLAQIQSEFGSFVNLGPYKLAGIQSGSGQVSIADKGITISGATNLKDLNIAGPNNVNAAVPSTDINYALGIDKKYEKLNIDLLKVQTSFGRLDITKAVIPLGKAPSQPMNLLVNAADIDLAKLLPFAVLTGSVPQKMQLAGIVQSQIAVSSGKQGYTIKTDSTKIKGLKLTYPDKTPFEQDEVSLIFEAEINPETKTINIKQVQLDSPQIKIRKGQLSQASTAGRMKLAGQVELDYDWTALTNLVGPYMPAGLTVKGKRQDSFNFSGEYPADKPALLLSSLSAKGGLGFDQADYMGLDFGQTNVNIVVKNGLLDIAPFSSVVNKGQLNFAAQADFKAKPPLFKTPRPMQIIKNVQIDDRLTGPLLKYLNPIFANSVNVNGLANLSCDKLSIPLDAKAKNSAEIVGEVSVSNLRLTASDLLGQILLVVGGSAAGTVITIHPTKFILRDGFLRYDDMQMDIGNNPVNFKGVIGLDKSLNMTVTLPYTTRGTTVRVDRQPIAPRITLPLKGTVDKPTIDVGKLIESQAEQQLEDQLKKGLEKLFR